MKKVYLMKGMAAMALGLVAASCSKMDGIGDGEQYSQEQVNANAEAAMGITIDPNQSWVMTQEVKADVTVNGFYGAKYEVTIYDANPLTGESVVAYGKQTVISGQTASFTFVAPKAETSVFAAIKDEKGYTYTKPAVIVDGQLTTSFGGSTASKAITRGITRGAADDFTVAVREMPNLSAYINDAVAISDANNVTYGGGVEHYLIPEGTTWSKNIPLIQSGSGISVYVEGTLNINAEQRVNGGCVFIVGPHGTVNIASGQKLTTNANNEANTVGSFYVYPGGTVQGAGALHFANGSGAYNYNGGTIDVGTINNNGGTLYNAGTIEADHMLGGAGLSIYENAGKMHIGEAAKGSGTANTRLHNNCWFECDGTLSLRNIQQGPGAYIKAANLEMSGSEDGTGDAAYIWAKGNSLIDISGAAAFNNIDVVGPDENNVYAYIQLGYVEGAYGAHNLTTATNYSTEWKDLGDGNKEYMTTCFRNNIRLSIDNATTSADTNGKVYNPTAYEKVLNMLNGTLSYSTAAYNEAWAQYGAKTEMPQVGNGNAVLVSKGQVDEVKTESSCSPGVVVVPPTPVEETTPIYSYAFEDTKLGDYDMNDVVIKVTEDEDNDKLLLQVVAAGATVDINIRLYDNAGTDGMTYGSDYITLQDENGNTEIHDMFGVDKGAMVNTGKGVTADPFTITIDKGNYSADKLRLAIVSERGEMRLAGSGDAPFGVIIPWDWKWPVERVCITNAYNKTNSDELEADQSFANYAENAGHAENWFKYPTGSVMK